LRVLFPESLDLKFKLPKHALSGIEALVKVRASAIIRMVADLTVTCPAVKDSGMHLLQMLLLLGGRVNFLGLSGCAVSKDGRKHEARVAELVPWSTTWGVDVYFVLLLKLLSAWHLDWFTSV
jgi:hypothetical protein